MVYQAVAFDMDGTLLNNHQLISPENISAINKIKLKGIEIVLVTGRHHSVVYPYYYQLGLDKAAVCCNGTYLYDFPKNKSLYANPLSKDQARSILELVNKFGIHTLIYTDKLITYELLDDHLKICLKWIDSLPGFLKPKVKHVKDFTDVIEQAQCIYKFATSSSDIPRLEAFVREILASSDLECEWSWSNRADVALKGNNKAMGLARWAAIEDIPLSNIVAFGDNYNDISMLNSSGLSVVMGNANDEIKEKADMVIGNNNESSIAKALNDIFTLY